MTLLGSCGWFVAGRKYRQEVKGLKADNRMKDMDLGVVFAEKFCGLIAESLENEVKDLRTEICQLRDAIQQINVCPHRSQCPVVGRLREHEGIMSKQSCVAEPASVSTDERSKSRAKLA